MGSLKWELVITCNGTSNQDMFNERCIYDINAIE